MANFVNIFNPLTLRVKPWMTKSFLTWFVCVYVRSSTDRVVDNCVQTLPRSKSLVQHTDNTNKYRKSYELARALHFIYENFQHITRAHKSRNVRAENVRTIFFYYVFNKINRVVRTRILQFLGLLFFQSPMFAKHSTRSL